MKAVDYFEKYKDKVSAAKTADEIETVIFNLFKEMRDEMFELMDKRKTRKLPAIKSTILEFNQKWNKVIRLFEKEKIEHCMKVDGFYSAERAVLSEAGYEI